MKRKKGDGSVFQRGAVWWIKYYRNGKPYRETSGSDKEKRCKKALKEAARRDCARAFRRAGRRTGDDSRTGGAITSMTTA